MSYQFKKEASSPSSRQEEDDQWIFDAISLNYKRQSDQTENPHLKLQKILAKMPSPTSINLSEPMVIKALTSMRDFLKKNVVEVGKVYDGDIPEPMHHDWMEAEVAFTNLDMDRNLGRDPSADLKIFLNNIRTLNNEFLQQKF